MLIIKRASRFPVRFFASRHGPVVPDSAPSAQENDTWLSQLKQFNTKVNAVDVENGRFEGTENEDGVSYEVLGQDTSGNYDVRYDRASLFRSIRQLPLLGSNRKNKTQNFADLRLIQLESGKGGDGCVSFFRDAGRAIGPPDGGDGGDGGSVYVQAISGLNSLHKLRSRYVGGAGANGAARQLDGGSGKDVLITVPVGTTIRWMPEDVKSEEEFVDVKAIGRGKNMDYIQLFREQPEDTWIFKEKDREYHYGKEWFNSLNKTVKTYDDNMREQEIYGDVIPFAGIDLSKPSERPVKLLEGGNGGLGNMHFLTQEVRNPRFCKRGRKGLTGNFLFELKMLADFGLVGLPNSGKSTLLNAILRANSKVGHWEFTTLLPLIGTITSENLQVDNFTVADIPGIIEGAASCPELPKGMGSEFLRHIERSNILVFVVSLENDPKRDLEILLGELKFGKDRLQGKRVVVLSTKADLVDDNQKYDEFKNHVKQVLGEAAVIPICAKKGQNVDRVVDILTKYKQEIESQADSGCK